MSILRAATLFALPLACALLLPARAPAQGWGTLKGQVIYVGNEKPNQKADLNMHKDERACLKAAKGAIIKDDLVVNPKNKGLRWVVVWLTVDKDGKADHEAPLPIHPSLKDVKEKSVVMDQPCCKFEPHIAILREGQVFIGKNSSELTHNMRVIGIGPNSKNTKNLTLTAKSEQQIGTEPWKVTVTRQGRPNLPNPVNCDIHRWMSGWLFVFAHPYIAVTDEDGKFTIDKVPAGKFRVVMWHERDIFVLGEEGKVGDFNGRLVTIDPKQPTDMGKIELKDKPKDD